MKYTEEDVIKSTLDYRLENARGCKCIAGNNVNNLLDGANDSLDYFDKVLVDIVADSKTPFIFRDCVGVYHSSYIILKKEPKKKIVPFDLSLEKDRKALKGKWIKPKSNIPIYNEEVLITYINDHIVKAHNEIIGPRELLEFYVFADKGKPVGKEVEE